MPGGDKTGPLGMGPGTGRGMGPCVNNSIISKMRIFCNARARRGGRGGRPWGKGRVNPVKQ